MASSLIRTAIGLTAGVPVAAGEEWKVTTLPLDIAIEKELDGKGREALAVVKAPLGYALKFGAVPFNAKPLSEIVGLGRHEFDGAYFSACRDLDIVVRLPDSGTEKYATFTMVVADPWFVTPQPFPQRGKIKAHESCGTSTANEVEAAAANPLPGMVDAAVAAAVAVDQVLEKAEKKRKEEHAAERAATRPPTQDTGTPPSP